MQDLKMEQFILHANDLESPIVVHHTHCLNFLSMGIPCIKAPVR